jgi:cytochrome c biogenesis protein CcmG, thiol:disulfide interchange protein DsbE
MIGRSLVFAAAWALVAASAPAGAAVARVGEAAPDFSVTTVTGQPMNLVGLRGQVVVVNRWATWCIPCRQEFLLFDRYAALRAKHGFTILAIESGGAGASGAMTKIAKQVHFPVVLEHKAKASKYPVIDGGVPTNYVIDRAGVVRYAKAGAFELEELEAVVRPLLSESAPAD